MHFRDLSTWIGIENFEKPNLNYVHFEYDLGISFNIASSNRLGIDSRSVGCVDFLDEGQL